MSTSLTKKAMLGTIAGSIAMMGMLAPASAKHRHHHHHRHFHGLYAPLYIAPSYNDCGYYYWKWRHTGSRFWKAKYFSCIY